MNQTAPYVYYAGCPYPYADASYSSPGYPYQITAQHMTPQQPSGSMIPGVPGVPGQPVVEESYIENILRLNLGKVITVYQTFENNSQWNAKIFRGRLEAAGRDHIILSDPQTGRRYLLLMVNTDYITSDEELRYVPPVLPPGVRNP
jgi:spore germination protein Q